MLCLIDSTILLAQNTLGGFPGGSVVKNYPARARDMGDVSLIPGSGRSLGGGNVNPL